MTARRHSAGGEQEFAEERASLVRITFGPLIWAMHFLLSYAGAAVFCAKFPHASEHLDLLVWGIGLATLVALAGIAWQGQRSFHQWRKGNEDSLIEEDADGSSEDRHQFLGHAALLLAVISAVGVIYTALPAFLTATCR
ncbi:hypothetical protein [Rubellimicrobium roseum]|uniref:Uncharacterized protein n=1 Tax=Rubellimicrobium roseum TaxID=687525 RepID=A0A5C4NM71_9RHOB|nr:hypothetical protein [Rubellimicrobium roseum]TNC74985.1 hypothetical protein FHG71_02355 [Rubellimicrobium roseum]